MKAKPSAAGSCAAVAAKSSAAIAVDERVGREEKFMEKFMVLEELICGGSNKRTALRQCET